MKKGISVIVVTVLMILITVAVVMILWVAVIPIIRNNLEFQDLKARVDIVMNEVCLFMILIESC